MKKYKRINKKDTLCPYSFAIINLLMAEEFLYWFKNAIEDINSKDLIISREEENESEN